MWLSITRIVDASPFLKRSGSIETGLNVGVVSAKAQAVRRRYIAELGQAAIRELAIRRRVSHLDYSRRCAEASAVQANLKAGIRLAPGMEIGYVVKDAKKWAVDPERDASGFDEVYYGKLLDKAWAEVAFVFRKVTHNDLYNLPNLHTVRSNC